MKMKKTIPALTLAFLMCATASAGDIGGRCAAGDAVGADALSAAAELSLGERGALCYDGQDAELWINGVQYTGEVRVAHGVTFASLDGFCEAVGGGECRVAGGEANGVSVVIPEANGRGHTDIPSDVLREWIVNVAIPEGIAPDWVAALADPAFEVTCARVSGGRYDVTASAGDEYVVSNGRYFFGWAKCFADGRELFVPVAALARAFGFTCDDGVNVTGGGEVVCGDDFYREDEVYWLSHIINAEAGCEPLDGKIAVGNVVLNRVADPAFPDTIYSVIWDRRFGIQFSPTESGTISLEPSEESVIAAKICLEGDTLSPEVMYFVNPAIAECSWVQDNRPYIMTIGRHAFFG